MRPPGTPTDVETPQPRRLFRVARQVGRGDVGGLLVAAALAASLTLVTLSVLLNGPTARLDRFLDARLPPRGEGPPVLHSVAVLVSTVAYPLGTIGAVAALAVGWSAWTRSRWPLLTAMPSLLAVGGTVLVGKQLVGRPGPPDSHSTIAHIHRVLAIGDPGYFPSGHTATALVGAGILTVLLGQFRPSRRRFFRLVAGAWTLLVGGSMIWLHYHWLSDVVGAILLGTLVLWLLYRWPLCLAVTAIQQTSRAAASGSRS